MRYILPSLLSFSLFGAATPALAVHHGKKPVPVTPAPSAATPPTVPEKAAPVATATTPAATTTLAGSITTADAGPNGPNGPNGKKKDDSLDSMLDQASPDAAKPVVAKPVAKPAEATKPPVKSPNAAAPNTAKPATPAVPAVAAEPPPPATDDNDASAEAAAPAALRAVQQTGETRRRGPYELGPLDCRVLDGAGIERLLPNRVVSGEEPDILCRVVVSQPANVLTVEHDLTLTVVVGTRESWKQVRKIRMSSIGRRALVFVIPADRIASDDTAEVKLNALLSAPAAPAGGRQVKFKVETED